MKWIDLGTFGGATAELCTTCAQEPARFKLDYPGAITVLGESCWQTVQEPD